jgi:hypothetical protein
MTPEVHMKAHSIDSRDGLLQELVAIEKSGWESPAGHRLLGYVRSHIVRPQVRAAGLHGPVAEQAEATGWAVAWETLSRPSIHTAGSPWGLLWVAVRKAVAGERLAAHYQASVRNSWRAESSLVAQRQDGRVHTFPPPLSLSLLLEEGWEPEAEPWACTGLGRRLEAVIDGLVHVGWERRAAHAVVEGVALTAVRDGKATADAKGWRPLAARLALPPWQVRRVTVLLLGAPGWPGVVERMAHDGCQVLEADSIVAAMRSTTTSSWPPPPAAARRATAQRMQVPTAS